MAFKKIEQEFILSDSSLNVYGFRLNTEGYVIGEFLKNPIGYYGHEKEDGVLLRWEDLRIEGDKVIGKPVINLEHPRGERTVQEIEEGFLNAASVGNIVVLDYHSEPGEEGTEDVLVVDKWYNKECSLVDNPGNREAFRTELADSDGIPVSVGDLRDRTAEIKLRLATTAPAVKEDAPVLFQAQPDHVVITSELLEILDLNDDADSESVLRKLKELKDEGNRLRIEAEAVNRGNREREVLEILEGGLKDGRFTPATRMELELHFRDNPQGLKRLVGTMPAYQSIAERLRKIPDDIKDLADLSYDELDKTDKLQMLLTKAPDLYREKYQRKFGKLPANV